MGDYNSFRTNHDFMSFSIYNFLDNLLAAVRPSETLESEFQNRDEITTQVTPGGFSEDIFIFLSDREKEEYNCSVCYSVVKDAHQCRNGHKFCYSCIYVWSTCNRSGADCCPACRCDGVYARNDQINEKISRKRVKCITEGCNWRGFLRDFTDHDHRIYDFRELNTSIELPFIKSPESANLVSSADVVKKTESAMSDKQKNEADSDSNCPLTSTNNIAVKVEEERIATTTSSNSGRVLRAHLAPRRLVNNSDQSSSSSVSLPSTRTSIPSSRSTLNNSSRSNTISTRSPTSYRYSISNAHLSRLPRTSLNQDRNTAVSTETVSIRQVGQNESTQTTNLTDSSSETANHLADGAASSGRGATSTIPRRGVQLPAINPNNSSTVAPDRTPMEYRRLAPTYASRRGNFGMISPSEGREQLAMMLILLTSDLEDRVTLNEPPRGGGGDPLAATDQNPIGSSRPALRDNNAANRPSLRLGRSRLQEFRNLNRRLSEVANSLDRLIASTSRDNEQHLSSTTTSSTNFQRSPESSASNTASDVEDDFNFTGYNR